VEVKTAKPRIPPMSLTPHLEMVCCFDPTQLGGLPGCQKEMKIYQVEYP